MVQHVLLFLQAAEELQADYGPEVRSFLLGLAAFLVVLLLGRFVLVRGITGLIRRRNRRNPTLVEAIDRYAKLLVVVLAVAAAVAAAGFGHVFAGSALVVAALTLALGVAGQEVIGNLVSGLFLVADPEFNVDDWIAWEEGEGVVETIRFRVTQVRTPNNEVITVPNTTLATTAVRRPYSRDRFRIVVGLGIAMDEDLDEAIAVLKDAVGETDEVLAEPVPRVVVEELGDDAAQVRVEFWIDQPSRREVFRARSDYIRRLKSRLEAAGIAFSPPSEHELSGELRVDGADRPASPGS